MPQNISKLLWCIDNANILFNTLEENLVNTQLLHQSYIKKQNRRFSIKNTIFP